MTIGAPAHGQQHQEISMPRSWRHNFARRGDLVVALFAGIALTAALVVLGVRQASRIPMEDFFVVDYNDAQIEVALTANEAPLASASIAVGPNNSFSSPGGRMIEIHELPSGLRRICQHESSRSRQADLASRSRHVSLLAGWPLRVELIGDRTDEYPWEIRPSWLGVTLIEDGQPVGDMPYRPAILPLLANILIFALPIVIVLGLIRTQIALVRAARGNCTACGYPRPKTTCPECGREH